MHVHLQLPVGASKATGGGKPAAGQLQLCTKGLFQTAFLLEKHMCSYNKLQCPSDSSMSHPGETALFFLKSVIIYVALMSVSDLVNTVCSGLGLTSV